MIELETIRESKFTNLTKLSFAELRAACTQLQGWTVENLGASDDPTYDVVGMSYGAQDKPTIFINAGLHGLEWEAVSYALEFAKLISSPSDYLTDTAFIEQLKSEYHFYFIPLTSVWGYVHESRNNYNGVNTNRDFGTFSQKETTIIRDKVKQFNTVAFIDCHNVGYDATFPAVYTGNREQADVVALTNELIETLRDKTGLQNIDWYPIAHIPGSACSWVGQQKSSAGQNIFSMLLESYRFDSTSTQVYFGVNAILTTLKYFEIYQKGHHDSKLV